MRLALISLFVSCAVFGCKEKSDDPMRAFRDLEIVQNVNAGEFHWIQHGDHIFNLGDSVCARMFLGPENYGACEGSYPSLPSPGTGKHFSSPTGDTVILWGGNDGIAHVIDLSNSPDVTYLGNYFIQQQYSSGFYAGIHDGYLFGTIDNRTLGVFDLGLIGQGTTLPQDSLEVGRIALDGLSYTFHAAFQDTFAYVGGNGSHIYVLSIADPLHPYVVSDVQVQLSNGLQAYKNVLLNNGNGNIDLILLENPAMPIPIDRIDGVYANDIRLRDDFLYAATDGFLNIYDVASPTKPVLVRKLNTEYENIQRMYFFGDYLVAYSADEYYSNATHNRLYLYPNTP